jgi:hypothetical protein
VERITPAQEPFSAKALELFREMHALQSFGDRWWELHNKLFDELRAKPWEFPCIEPPGTPYEAGWNRKTSDEAQARYVALAAACGLAP